MPCSSGPYVNRRVADAVSVMLVMRGRESADAENFRGPGTGPSGSRLSSLGSRGQSLARRCTRKGPRVIDPGFVLETRVLTPRNVGLDVLHVLGVCASDVPQT